jgi:hypothetical protein
MRHPFKLSLKSTAIARPVRLANDSIQTLIGIYTFYTEKSSANFAKILKKMII